MKYSHLEQYADTMQRMADDCVEQILKGQCDGRYDIKLLSLKCEYCMPNLDSDLLIAMLGEREEFHVTDWDDDEISVDVAPEYVKNEGVSNLKVLSDQEIRVMLSKHYLWLYDEYGGVQADFSNCYIEDFDFSRADLCSSVMNGAKFVNCRFSHISMCTAECVGAKFNDCYLNDITCEECNFSGTEFRNSNLERGVFTHSNFQNALFVQSDVDSADFRLCCFADTDWVDTSTTCADMVNTVKNINDWENQGDVPGMEM